MVDRESGAEVKLLPDSRPSFCCLRMVKASGQRGLHQLKIPYTMDERD
jgi:hypothetical protein